MQQAIRGFRVVARGAGAQAASKRALHSSAVSHAFSKFAMPAMSPTMTEGGLATWKVSEGSAFSAGDVLLEIETDKATMDVEAQDDGVLAKILIQAGEKGVQVGKTIAILAEEGDDLSKAESEVKPDEDKPAQASSSSSSQPAPPKKEEASSHSPAASQPSGSTGHDSGSSTSQMFPSVSRLLAENNISSQQASQIKGSGIRGMLTKGDVLVHLGKVSSPMGSYQRGHGGVTAFGGAPPAGKGPAPSKGSEESKKSDVAPPQAKSLSAVELRSAIISGLAATTAAARSTPNAAAAPRDVIADVTATSSPVTAAKPAAKKDWLDGIL